MDTAINKRLFSNFVSLSLVQGINFLIPLLVMPFVITRVGADGFGVIAVAQVVMIYLTTIADYGFNLSATRDIALNKTEKKRVSEIFFTVLAAQLLITIALFVLLLTAALTIPFLQDHFFLYIAGFLYVLGQSFFVNWFFQGMEKMQYITAYSFISRVIFLVLVFAFIREKADGRYFLFFLGIGNTVAGLLSIFIAVRKWKLQWIQPRWSSIVREIKAGWQLTITNLSINTYLYCGIFILRLFTNDQIVGYYSIAERIFFAIRQVLSVFSQVVYPQICQFGEQGKEAAVKFFRRIYLPFLGLVAIGCLSLAILSPWIIGFFIHDGAALPVMLLRLFSILPLIVCLNIPAYQLLVVFDRKKSYLLVFSLATLLNIGLNLLLVGSYGAPGTVVAVITTEFFITAGLNLELYRNGLAGFVNRRFIG